MGTESFVKRENFSSLDGLDQFSANAGNQLIAARGAILRTISQADSLAGLREDLQYPDTVLTFDNEWSFRGIFVADDVSQQVAVGIGRASPDTNNQQSSIQIDGGDVYAHTADGSNKTRTIIEAATAGQVYDVYIEHEPGVEDRFWVGSTPPSDPDVTITSTLPTGTTNASEFHQARALATSGNAFDVDLVKFETRVKP